MLDQIYTDSAYLDWLEDQTGISISPNTNRSYDLLMEQLHRKVFEWTVPNDDNREGDGLEFRIDFSQLYNVDMNLEPPVSMLELILGLAVRLSRILSDESEDVGYWFGVLLDNTKLSKFNDTYYLDDYATASEVDNILNRIIYRNYKPNGKGGFFPLNDPPHDMRGIELWYQMQAYAMERNPL